MGAFEVSRNIDVLGVSCPLNAMRVKNALLSLEPGELIEVFIDEGEAVFRVARTLKDAGNRVVKVEPRPGGLSMIVEKGGKHA